MKNIFKDRINVINGILLLLLIAISVFIYIWLKGDRYFDKQFWYYTLSSKETDNRHYRILNFDLSSEDGGGFSINETQYELLDGERYNYINNLENDYEYRHLLPDSLKMEWFSYEDNTFYKVEAGLPKEKIEKEAKLIKKNIVVLTTILPDGNVSVGLVNEGAIDKKSEPNAVPIITLKSQKVSRGWNILKKYNSSLEKIDNADDFLKFLGKKYKWGMIAEVPEKAEASFIFVNDHHYIGNDIEFNKNKISPKENLLPYEYQIVWEENGKKYRGYFEFDPQELLSAINQLKSNSKTDYFDFIIVMNKKENHFQTFLQNDTGKINLKNISEKRSIEDA